MLYGEAAEVGPADGAIGVDQDAVRHDLEVEPLGGQAVFVDEHRERHTGLTDDALNVGAPGMLCRNRDQLEVVALVRLIEPLPPGQLLAAPSPRATKEQEEALAPKV